MLEYRIFNLKLGSYMTVKQFGFLVLSPDLNSPQSSQDEDLQWIPLGEFIGNPNFVIEQFTGVFDRASKKIFEGDLVELYKLSPTNEPNIAEIEPELVIINYIAPKFIFTYAESRYKFIEEMISISSILEVVGNIHQNKL